MPSIVNFPYSGRHETGDCRRAEMRNSPSELFVRFGVTTPMTTVNSSMTTPPGHTNTVTAYGDVTMLG
jgi:hypothetical protein